MFIDVFYYIQTLFKIVGLNSTVFSLCAFFFLSLFSCGSTETFTVSDLGLLRLAGQAVPRLCSESVYLGWSGCGQEGRGSQLCFSVAQRLLIVAVVV